MASNMIFISYSRRDKEFVERLTKDLKAAGLNIWLDTESLTPGTTSWERAIREGIRDSAAIILVASPDALQSDFVQGELTVAKLLNRPIYPIWANGDNWIDCVPLDMANYQYIDSRGDNYQAGQNSLQKTLNSVLDTSEGTITLGLPTHETVELNLAQFNNARDILNHIYLKHLQFWYEQLTYGTEWVLGNIHTKQLAVNWDWLTLDKDDAQQRMRYLSTAGRVSLKDFGFENGSYWAVWSPKWIHRAGVAIRDVQLRHQILSKNGERDLWLLNKENMLKIVHPSEINIAAYPHHFVVAVFQTSKRRFAFVEV